MRCLWIVGDYALGVPNLTHAICKPPKLILRVVETKRKINGVPLYIIKTEF